MKLLSIASGSSGNCVAVCSDQTVVLIDTGISRKRIEEGLNQNQLTLSDVSGILITHEHSDHISGLGVVSRKYHIPIYSTIGTITQIQRSSSLGQIENELFHFIEPDITFPIGDLKIEPFQISHDAVQPIAYRVYHGSSSVAVATDMGTYDEYIVSHLKGVDGLLLEANHDVRMLETGAYPYYLKQRILSDTGHLSNETSGRLLNAILHDGLKHVVLGHLSKENNYEKLAYEAVRMEITLGDNPYSADDFDIQVARRSEPSHIMEI